MSRPRGIIPILQTPFDADGSIDLESMASQIEFCVASGVGGVVFPANASEFYCLSDRERLATSEVVVERVAGRVPVVLSVSGVSAAHASEFAEQAASLGADAVMALPPYTRRCRLDTIVSYYAAVAEAAAAPVIVQTVGPPLGTPITDVGVDALLEQVAGVRAIKEERPPTPQRIERLAERYGSRLDGIFGGSNGQWLVNEARRGATGCMPATALVDWQVRIQRLIDAGSWEDAEAAQAELQPLVSYLSLYGVVMVKELLVRRGILRSAYVRDPEAPLLEQGDLGELERLAGDMVVLSAEAPR